MALTKILNITVNTGRSGESVKTVNDRLEQLVIALGKNREELKKLKKEARETGDFEKNAKQIAALEGNVKKLSNEYNTLQRASQGIKRNFSGLTSAFRNAALQIVGIGSAVALIGTAFRNAAQTVADFDQAQADLAAITGKTREEIEDLTQQAIELGKASIFTATEITNLQVELSKLGFSQDEILAATEGIQNLAAATGEDLVQSAIVAASTLRSFGLEAEETDRVVGVLAKSFTESALDLDKFSVAISTVGPVAQAAGVSIEQTTALLGTLVDRGIDASTAGTGLRNIFLDLAEKGLTLDEALAQINQSTNQNATALDLFGKRGATVSVVLANNTDASDRLNDSLQDTEGVVQRMADERLNSLQGSLEQVEGAWESFVLSIERGDGTIGRVLRSALDLVTQLLDKLAIAQSESRVAFQQTAENFITATEQFTDNSAFADIFGTNKVELDFDNAKVQEANKEFNELRKLAGQINEDFNDEEALQATLDRYEELKKIFGDQLNNARARKLAGDGINANERALLAITAAVNQEAGKTAELARERLEVIQIQKKSDEELATLAAQNNQRAIDEINRRKNVELAAQAEIDLANQEALDAKNQKEAEAAAKALERIRQQQDTRLQSLQQEEELAKRIEDARSGKEGIEADYAEELASAKFFYDEKLKLAKGNNKLIEAETESYNRKVENINAEYADKQLTENRKTIDYKLDLLDEELAGQVQINDRLIQDETQKEKKILDLKIKTFEEKLKLIQDAALADGVVTEAELANLQKIYNAILNFKLQLDTITQGEEDAEERSSWLAQYLGLTDTEAELLVERSISITQQIADAVFETQAAANEARLEQQIQFADALYQTEVRNLQARNEQGLLTEVQFIEESKRLENEKNQRIYQYKLDAFRKEQRIAKAQIAINTALGVSAAFAQPPPTTLPQKIIEAAYVTAQGVIQAAAVGSQPPPLPPIPIYRQGGRLLEGPSHDRGGIPIYQNGSLVAEAEGGEFIINRQATAKYLPLIEAINQAGLNRPTPVVEAFSNVEYGTSPIKSAAGQPQMIRAYVVESDITDTQKNISRYNSRAEIGE